MILNWIRDNFHPLWHFRKKSAAFRWVTRHVRIDVGVRIKNVDHKVYVDLLRNPHMVGSPNDYERQDLDLMIDLISRLDLRRMFDVGANLGIYSFSFAANAHEGRVVAFEPDLVNAKLFEKTNARCPRHDIVLERKAVADTMGTASFAVDNMSGATGTLRLNDVTFSERIYGGSPPQATVETTTIDEACKRFFSPDFIKIDVEGAELDVLKGASETLSTVRPIILIEIGSEKALRNVRDLLDKTEYVLRPASTPNYLAYHRHSDPWDKIGRPEVNRLN
jgi:FkbM family methyltransferase